SPSWKSPSLPLVSSVCSVDGTLLPGETLGLATGFVVSPLLVTVAPGVPSDAVALGASVGPPVVGLFTPPFTPDELPGPASSVGAEERPSPQETKLPVPSSSNIQNADFMPLHA